MESRPDNLNIPIGRGPSRAWLYTLGGLLLAIELGSFFFFRATFPVVTASTLLVAPVFIALLFLGKPGPILIVVLVPFLGITRRHLVPPLADAIAKLIS